MPGATQRRGNCMRHSWKARPMGVMRRGRWPSRSPGAVDTVDAGDPPASYRNRSWGHTQAHHAVLTGTRCTRPTSTPTFPHQQAERSPHNQHVLSFNPDHPVQETRPTNAGRRQQKTGARKPSTGISVELGGFEPPTSSMPWKRATNCAIAPLFSSSPWRPDK